MESAIKFREENLSDFTKKQDNLKGILSPIFNSFTELLAELDSLDDSTLLKMLPSSLVQRVLGIYSISRNSSVEHFDVCPFWDESGCSLNLKDLNGPDVQIQAEYETNAKTLAFDFDRILEECISRQNSPFVDTGSAGNTEKNYIDNFIAKLRSGCTKAEIVSGLNPKILQNIKSMPKILLDQDSRVTSKRYRQKILDSAFFGPFFRKVNDKEIIEFCQMCPVSNSPWGWSLFLSESEAVIFERKEQR